MSRITHAIAGATLLAALFRGGDAASAQMALSDHDNAPQLSAMRSAAAPHIDGNLSEGAWSSAQPASHFLQVVPEEGAPASELTEVRVLYDGAALYIGARLFDRGVVTSRLGRRDMARGDSDWFAVTLDSYHDHQTGYVFMVNPAGVRYDALRVENTTDPSWDAVWEAAVHRDADGWTVEIRIPFSQLRFSNQPVQTWGIQIEREINRRGEVAQFAFTPRREQAGVGRFGHLVGLRDLQSGNPLELLPYVVGRTERIDRGENPYRSPSETRVSAGVDFKYRLSSDLVMDATINPDFGQVEVDPAVVNLSALETFYQEKRPFFLEGAGIFDFGTGAVGPGGVYRNLFYTRRIGRRPQISAPTIAADAPDATTILSAAKLTSRRRNGWSIGLLHALTEEETGTYQVTEDTSRTYVAEPLSNYLVARVIRSSRQGGTRVGMIGTAVNRHLNDDRSTALLRSAAYTGGLDFSHEWQRRAWRLSGFLAASHLRGDSVAMRAPQLSAPRYYQRPDARHLTYERRATSLTGAAGQLQIFKQAGLHWIGDAAVYAVAPGYEVNDMGFQSRADIVGSNGRLIYQQNRPSALLRQYSVVGLYGISSNWDGDVIGGTLELGTSGQFHNLATYQFALGYQPAVFDDRLTRGGPLARTTARRVAQLSLASDPRKGLTLGLLLSTIRDAADGSVQTAAVTLGLKPTNRWNLSLRPSYEIANVAAQYLMTVDDVNSHHTYARRYVFSPLEQRTLALETRFNFTLSPALGIQVYAQPFLSSGDYGSPMQLRAPRTFAFDVYGVDAGNVTESHTGYEIDPDGSGPSPAFALSNPDFNLRSLRANAVLRWDWRPGSSVYVAWQQNRRSQAQFGTFDFGRERGALFQTAPDNILVVKMNYWFNP